MTLKYLLDTNVLSEALRPFPDPRVLDRLREHQAEMAIAGSDWG